MIYLGFLLLALMLPPAVIVLVPWAYKYRALRRAYYEKENELIRKAQLMNRFKRWIKSQRYVGPDQIQPKWPTFK
jgi:hypothetical protein